MVTETSKLPHDNSQVETVLNRLEEVEGSGKYDNKKCTAVLDLWDVFSGLPPESFANYPHVFTRLVKVVSRTILGGLWAKLQESSNSRLRHNLTLVQSHLEKVSFEDGKLHCQAVSSLLDTTPWKKQSVTDVLSPAEGIQTLDKIDALLVEEGWILLQSRLETLTGLPEPLLAAFAEACVLKAQSQLPSDEEKTSSYSDLPVEKFYEVLCLYCLVIARQSTDNEFAYRRLNSCLSYQDLLKVLETLILESPLRLQPTWKGWRNSADRCLDVAEMALRNANELEKNESELKSFFTLWLSLFLQRRKGYGEREGTLLQLRLPPGPDIFQDDDMDALLQKLRSLAESSFKNEYAYRYGDWMVENFGLSKATRATCVELYLIRLSPDVSKFLSMHDREEEKDSCNELSINLGLAFQSLSLHFSAHSQVSFEIALTAFSLNPTQEGLESLREMTSDSNSGIDLKSKLARSHNESIGLPPALFLDLSNVVIGARVNRLTCFRDSWDKFSDVCQRHLTTRGKDIRRRSQLDLVKPTDFSIYEGLEPAFDDDDTGYEAGYLPNEEDVAAFLLEEETGQKVNKIREPKSRMNSVYRKTRLLKKMKEAAVSGINLKPPKIKRGLPLQNKPENETSSPPTLTVKRKYVRKMPVFGPAPKQQVKRKYVRKVPFSKDSKSKEPVGGSIFKRLTYRKSIVQMKKLALLEAAKNKEIPGKEAENEKHKVHDNVVPEPELVKDSEQSDSSRRKGSSRVEGIQNKRYRPFRSQRTYKVNDTSPSTVQSNQKICRDDGKSGIWPSTHTVTVKEGTYIFPPIPCHFPVAGDQSASMTYHESTPVSHFLRSIKPLTRSVLAAMGGKFNGAAKGVLTNGSRVLTNSYISSPLVWRKYMGEKIENNLDTTPIELNHVEHEAQTEAASTPHVKTTQSMEAISGTERDEADLLVPADVNVNELSAGIASVSNFEELPSNTTVENGSMQTGTDSNLPNDLYPAGILSDEDLQFINEILQDYPIMDSGCAPKSSSDLVGINLQSSTSILSSENSIVDAQVHVEISPNILLVNSNTRTKFENAPNQPQNSISDNAVLAVSCPMEASLDSNDNFNFMAELSTSQILETEVELQESSTALDEMMSCIEDTTLGLGRLETFSIPPTSGTQIFNDSGTSQNAPSSPRMEGELTLTNINITIRSERDLESLNILENTTLSTVASYEALVIPKEGCNHKDPPATAIIHSTTTRVTELEHLVNGIEYDENRISQDPNASDRDILVLDETGTIPPINVLPHFTSTVTTEVSAEPDVVEKCDTDYVSSAASTLNLGESDFTETLIPDSFVRLSPIPSEQASREKAGTKKPKRRKTWEKKRPRRKLSTGGNSASSLSTDLSKESSSATSRASTPSRHSSYNSAVVLKELQVRLTVLKPEDVSIKLAENKAKKGPYFEPIPKSSTGLTESTMKSPLKVSLPLTSSRKTPRFEPIVVNPPKIRNLKRRGSKKQSGTGNLKQSAQSKKKAKEPKMEFDYLEDDGESESPSSAAESVASEYVPSGEENLYSSDEEDRNRKRIKEKHYEAGFFGPNPNDCLQTFLEEGDDEDDKKVWINPVGTTSHSHLPPFIPISLPPVTKLDPPPKPKQPVVTIDLVSEDEDTMDDVNRKYSRKFCVFNGTDVVYKEVSALGPLYGGKLVYKTSAGEIEMEEVVHGRKEGSCKISTAGRKNAVTIRRRNSSEISIHETSLQNIETVHFTQDDGDLEILPGFNESRDDIENILPDGMRKEVDQNTASEIDSSLTLETEAKSPVAGNICSHLPQNEQELVPVNCKMAENLGEPLVLNESILNELPAEIPQSEKDDHINTGDSEIEEILPDLHQSLSPNAVSPPSNEQMGILENRQISCPGSPPEEILSDLNIHDYSTDEQFKDSCPESELALPTTDRFTITTKSIRSAESVCTLTSSGNDPVPNCIPATTPQPVDHEKVVALSEPQENGMMKKCIVLAAPVHSLPTSEFERFLFSQNRKDAASESYFANLSLEETKNSMEDRDPQKCKTFEPVIARRDCDKDLHVSKFSNFEGVGDTQNVAQEENSQTVTSLVTKSVADLCNHDSSTATSHPDSGVGFSSAILEETLRGSDETPEANSVDPMESDVNSEAINLDLVENDKNSRPEFGNFEPMEFAENIVAENLEQAETDENPETENLDCMESDVNPEDTTLERVESDEGAKEENLDELENYEDSRPESEKDPRERVENSDALNLEQVEKDENADAENLALMKNDPSREVSNLKLVEKCANSRVGNLEHMHAADQTTKAGEFEQLENRLEIENVKLLETGYGTVNLEPEYAVQSTDAECLGHLESAQNHVSENSEQLNTDHDQITAAEDLEQMGSIRETENLESVDAVQSTEAENLAHLGNAQNHVSEISQQLDTDHNQLTASEDWEQMESIPETENLEAVDADQSTEAENLGQLESYHSPIAENSEQLDTDHGQTPEAEDLEQGESIHEAENLERLEIDFNPVAEKFKQVDGTEETVIGFEILQRLDGIRKIENLDQVDTAQCQATEAGDLEQIESGHEVQRLEQQEKSYREAENLRQLNSNHESENFDLDQVDVGHDPEANNLEQEFNGGKNLHQKLDANSTLSEINPNPCSTVESVTYSKEIATVSPNSDFSSLVTSNDYETSTAQCSEIMPLTISEDLPLETDAEKYVTAQEDYQTDDGAPEVMQETVEDVAQVQRLIPIRSEENCDSLSMDLKSGDSCVESTSVFTNSEGHVDYFDSKQNRETYPVHDDSGKNDGEHIDEVPMTVNNSFDFHLKQNMDSNSANDDFVHSNKERNLHQVTHKLRTNSVDFGKLQNFEINLVKDASGDFQMEQNFEASPPSKNATDCNLEQNFYDSKNAQSAYECPSDFDTSKSLETKPMEKQVVGDLLEAPLTQNFETSQIADNFQLSLNTNATQIFYDSTNGNILSDCIQTLDKSTASPIVLNLEDVEKDENLHFPTLPTTQDSSDISNSSLHTENAAESTSFEPIISRCFKDEGNNSSRNSPASKLELSAIQDLFCPTTHDLRNFHPNFSECEQEAIRSNCPPTSNSSDESNDSEILSVVAEAHNSFYKNGEVTKPEILDLEELEALPSDCCDSKEVSSQDVPRLPQTAIVEAFTQPVLKDVETTPPVTGSASNATLEVASLRTTNSESVMKNVNREIVLNLNGIYLKVVQNLAELNSAYCNCEGSEVLNAREQSSTRMPTNFPIKDSSVVNMNLESTDQSALSFSCQNLTPNAFVGDPVIKEFPVFTVESSSPETSNRLIPEDVSAQDDSTFGNGDFESEFPPALEVEDSVLPENDTCTPEDFANVEDECPPDLSIETLHSSSVPEDLATENFEELCPYLHNMKVPEMLSWNNDGLQNVISSKQGVTECMGQLEAEDIDKRSDICLNTIMRTRLIFPSPGAEGEEEIGNTVEKSRVCVVKLPRQEKPFQPRVEQCKNVSPPSEANVQKSQRPRKRKWTEREPPTEGVRSSLRLGLRKSIKLAHDLTMPVLAPFDSNEGSLSNRGGGGSDSPPPALPCYSNH